MKKTFVYLAGSLAISFSLLSCGNNSSTKETAENADSNATEKTCLLALDHSAVAVNWTAFKFTELVGVNGKFDQIGISGDVPGKTVPEIFANASFKVPVSSVNTGNPDRDAKIQKFFFGKLANSTEMTGKVKSIEESKIVILFRLNDQENILEADYTLSGDTVIVNGVLNTDNWGAQGGIKALNEECKVLHTGKDGKSFLSPEVKIEIKALLKKQCD